MIRRTTEQIIKACLCITQEYDDSCRSFLGEPGKEGIYRKVKFLELVSSLQRQENTPEQAFVKVYDFYLSQKTSSRLNNLIKKVLFWVLDIQSHVLQGKLYRDALAILRVENTFHEKASAIKAEIAREKLPSEKSYAEIRKNARLLAQSARTYTGLFKVLPDELLIKIAGKTGNPEIHNEGVSEKIAAKYLNRPASNRR